MTRSDPPKAILPGGVESSVWTELNVTLLGEKMRIIQIETRFESIPHMLSSFVCANSTKLGNVTNGLHASIGNNSHGYTELKQGMPLTASQSINTNQYFYYLIQGGLYNTAIKVNIFTN